MTDEELEDIRRDLVFVYDYWGDTSTLARFDALVKQYKRLVKMEEDLPVEFEPEDEL